MNSVIHRVIFAALLCIASDAHALSLNRFLGSAADAPAMAQRREDIGVIAGSAPGFRWLNRMEVRIETDEFQLSRQKYAVRLIPNDPDALAAEDRLHEALLASARAEGELAMHRALKIRYALAIDLLYRQDLLDLNHRMTTVAEDRLNVLRKTMNTPDFQPGDIVRAEEDLTVLNLERLSLEGTLTEIRERIGRCVNDPAVSPDWSPGALVEIGQIEDMLGRERDMTENVYLENGRRRTAVARQRYELEKSADGIRISYVEAGWNEADSGSFDKAFSLEMGVEIPLDRSRPNLDRRNQDLLSERLQERDVEAELTEKRLGLVHELKRQITRYRFLVSRKRESGKPELLRTWSGVEGISPLPLLNIQETILKDELAQVEHLYSIYTHYVEWLDISGTLSERPLRNHISRSREPMEGTP